MKKLTLVLALLCFAMAPAFATSITGNIGFTGSVQVNSTLVTTASQVTAWSGLCSNLVSSNLVCVQATDISGISAGDAVTFYAPYNYTTTAIAAFWSVDGFVFDLGSGSIGSTSATSVTLVGIGTLTKSGLNGTTYNWSMTLQDPNETLGPPRFSFSASAAPTPTPEPASLVLLSAGLIGLGGLVRRRK